MRTAGRTSTPYRSPEGAASGLVDVLEFVEMPAFAATASRSSLASMR